MNGVEQIDTEKVGMFLKELRIKKKVSQRQVADELYMTRQSVSLWETGKTLPDYDSAVLLANYYNISIGELFAGKIITDRKELNKATANIIRVEFKKYQTKLIKIIIIFTLILLGFLNYYFVNTYNSIHIYTSNIEDSTLEINGVLTRSVNDIYLNINTSIVANNMCLYYKDDTLLLCKDNSSSINFSEKIGYSELVSTENFDEFLNNITLKLNNKIYKLDFVENYKNNDVKFEKDKNVIEDKYDEFSKIISSKIRDEFEYDKEDNSYKLTIKDDDVVEIHYFPNNETYMVAITGNENISIIYNNLSKKLESFNYYDKNFKNVMYSYDIDEINNSNELQEMYKKYYSKYIGKYLED